MTPGGISVRYARALVELAEEQGKAAMDKLGGELANFAEIMAQSTDLQVVLHNPSIDLDERKQLVIRLVAYIKGGKTMQNLLCLLLDRDRIGIVPEVSRAFQQLADERANVVRATVTSAAELTTLQVNSIKKALTDLSGKKVIVETHVDASLLGGVVTKLGDKVYDGSIRTQLDGLRLAAAAKV